MLDMPLEEYRHNIPVAALLSFNPSYAGYASGSFNVRHHSFYEFRVSILLMLDMPLEVSEKASFLVSDKGFNPSYAGYASGRLAYMVPSQQSLCCFNPSYAGYASGSICYYIFLTIIV